jgi:multidrug efflux pump subunit AcrA (membrane-fusion protein)
LEHWGKENKMLKKSVIVIAVVLVSVTALNVIFSLTAGKRRAVNDSGVTSSTVFTVRTEEAETRTLQAYLEVNANIISGNQVAVMPDANGKLSSMRVSLGSVVQRGALIAQVDPSRPGTLYELSSVYAPVSGMVVSSPQPVGSTVSTGTVLMTIAVADTLEIEALIPEREVGQLTTGLKASIRLEAFPGEIFTATLTQVSPVVDPVSRTKKITMRFDRNDTRINPGMFARVKLNTRTYPNVVSIPQEALVEHRGRTIVYVLNANADSDSNEEAGMPRVEMREVNTGVNVDREVEIRSGLEPGEAVVVQGQQFLTDGVPVRVIGRKI